MKTYRILASAGLFALISATSAYADDCSGRDHTAGTVLGAAGGAAIGGAATHDAGGAIAGAVVGGLAGNAISRSQDCDRGSRRGYDSYDNRGPAVGYYGRSYQVAPDENDYWGVESYGDFSADYRHISESIDRAKDQGSLSPREAYRFSRRLQQIRFQADTQQRRGRFNPQDTEYQLGQLRDDMRSARHNNRDNQNPGGYDRR